MDITKETADKFALEWVAAFNSHNIDTILAHYAEQLEFYSPLIKLLGFNDTGKITNREDLKKYFLIGLKTYPALNFKLHNIFVGVDTFIVYYTSVNGRMASEVFRLNAAKKAITVFCNYSDIPSTY